MSVRNQARRASRRMLQGLNSRCGAAAAEFAILTPLLMTMLFGMFQMGLLMFSYNQMETAARDTTRSMAVCEITDTTAAETQTRPELAPWMAAAATITPTIGASDVSTTVTVDAASAMILNFIPIALGPITATVTMAKEPLAFGGGTC